MTQAPRQAPRQELHLFFTRKGKAGVILYRAAAELYRLIGWDVARGRFTPGQWLRRRVYEDACALSPDGRHFVYGAQDRGGAFMAISHPPFFSAIAHFADVPIREVGGFFRDSRTVSLCHLARGGGPRDLECGLRLDPDPEPWAHRRSPGDWMRMPEPEVARIREGLEERRGAPARLRRQYHCDGPRLYDVGKDTPVLDCAEMAFAPMVPPYAALGQEGAR